MQKLAIIYWKNMKNIAHISFAAVCLIPDFLAVVVPKGIKLLLSSIFLVNNVRTFYYIQRFPLYVA